jgi:tripartite-type tricarboxylate transporter receptor subunit TctC
MRQLIIFISTICLLGLTPLSQAQEFPNRPVTIVVPYAAGGSTDILGRTLAESLTRELKQQFIIENAGGAGGTIGAARVAKAQTNGYTLLFHNMGHAAAPALYRTLSYDPLNDFEPLGSVADVPMILVGRKTLSPNTLAELIPYLRSNRDKANFAHSGAGSTAQLCSMLFMSTIQTDLTTIPYRGTGPALQDLIGNQVDLICDQPVSTTAHLQAGSIKAFAIANKTRLATLPTVPTFAEAGLPGFELAVWHGLYAPKGTSKAVLQTLEAALKRALHDPALIQRFASLGTAPVDDSQATAQALRSHLAAEIGRWGPLIKKAGVYAD